MHVKCIFALLKLTYACYCDLVESISRIVYMTISFLNINPRSTSLCFVEAQIHGTFMFQPDSDKLASANLYISCSQIMDYFWSEAANST